MTVTIDGTTGIASVDASASSPSIRGADANTGIYYGTDKIYMSTGGVKRFEISDGGDIQVPDSCKFELGNSQDLEIYFDGTNSIIDHTSTSGMMALRADGIKLQTTHSTPEDYIVCNEGGGVELYYDNTKAFEINGTDSIVVKALSAFTDDTYDVGHPSYRFDDIRASNGTIQTSDKNEKNTIVASDLGLSLSLIHI